MSKSSVSCVWHKDIRYKTASFYMVHSMQEWLAKIFISMLPSTCLQVFFISGLLHLGCHQEKKTTCESTIPWKHWPTRTSTTWSRHAVTSEVVLRLKVVLLNNPFLFFVKYVDYIYIYIYIYTHTDFFLIEYLCFPLYNNFFSITWHILYLSDP